MATTTSKVSLKLLIDNKSQKVLFAEAGKDFVDFLFHLLSLPVGRVIGLLSKNNMVGSLGNLYQSIEDLSDTYIQPGQSKDFVLKPQAPVISAAPGVPLLLSGEESAATLKKVYMCSCYGYVADDRNTICPSCRRRMSTEGLYVARPPGGKGAAGTDHEGGFVKGVVTYMVMDNLEVKPMSTISSIALLHKFKVQEVGALEERAVDLGRDEGLKLLKVSLQSKTVLTSVFLRNKGA